MHMQSRAAAQQQQQQQQQPQARNRRPNQDELGLGVTLSQPPPAHPTPEVAREAKVVGERPGPRFSMGDQKGELPCRIKYLGS
ncbi:hypothetical protein LX32DRAFT_643036 [Colletotrichum zoysiae]|uniref:Uncharacterized protein n=1 Tax=Colletotrichum zoysiae TaxID=1216348 RepID=A0AAD9LY34_9PEZI|nr:hypothetical protein LX32DRAFT_643036 [Colletotrichum zoysiae]